jgi:predicted RNA-binding Zn-ribbon protein involved in translation (DUF1610 family)
VNCPRCRSTAYYDNRDNTSEGIITRKRCTSCGYSTSGELVYEPVRIARHVELPPDYVPDHRPRLAPIVEEPEPEPKTRRWCACGKIIGWRNVTGQCAACSAAIRAAEHERKTTCPECGGRKGEKSEICRQCSDRSRRGGLIEVLYRTAPCKRCGVVIRVHRDSSGYCRRCFRKVTP